MKNDKRTTQPLEPKTKTAAANVENVAPVQSDVIDAPQGIDPRVTVTITVRPQVARFAQAMDVQLSANAYKGEEGWKQDKLGDLQERLKQEVVELDKCLYFQAQDRAAGELDSQGIAPGLKGVLAEAADVANFAMMIADNEGGLME